MLRIRDNITNLHIGEVYMDAQTRQVYGVIEEGTHTKLVSDFDLKLSEEGFRNFDPKISDEEIEEINRLLSSGIIIDESEIEPILLNLAEYMNNRGKL